MTALFNVYAVSLTATTNGPRARRLIAENKTERNADAIIEMAVMRRGVEEEFFVAEPAAPLAHKEAE